MTHSRAPLGDVLVLDLTRALSGPHAAMMLGDMGARVIKVESPDGDDSRLWGPPFLGADETRVSTYFLSCNRNKESIALDLKHEADREVLTELIIRADVLMENFRPGVLDRLGLPVDRLHEINPRLVVLSITGFGHDGPEADRAGYDQIAQGEGGLMSLTGMDEPTKVGVPVADLVAGMNGAYGVVTALYERERTGRGRVVRTSLLAAMVSVHAFQGTRWTVAGEVPGRVGNQHAAIAPYGLFRTGTSPIQVACGSEAQWRALAGELAMDPADPRFATNSDRITHREELIAEIESALAGAPAEHWLAALDRCGIPAGKVRALDEVYEWEQTRSQGLVVDVAHPVHGRLALPGPAVRLDDQSYAGGRREHLAPPVLDQHGEEIRAWLAQTRRDGEGPPAPA